MKRLKRFISIVLCGCVLCGVIFTQAGAMCDFDHTDHRYDEKYTVGDFEMFSYYKDNVQRYYVAGLSEQGKAKKELIIPYEYNGKKLWVGKLQRNTFYNPIYSKIITKDSITEKIFLTKDFATYGADDKSIFYDRNTGGDWYDLIREIESVIQVERYYNGNFKKIIYNAYYDIPISVFHFLVYRPIRDEFNNVIQISTGIKMYINNTLFSYCLENYISLGKDIHNSGDEPKVIRFSLDKNTFTETCVLANVNYMYNFDGALNRGHYWIDDVENGEKIITMPEAPAREGYIFGGWYLEPECVNEFDFNTPITKQEINWDKIYDLEETLPLDYVTFLYAKWIEN